MKKYIVLFALQLSLTIVADPETEKISVSFYQSPRFQQWLKQITGESIYNMFLKRKTAVENERLALEKNPHPWEKFEKKTSYWQRGQNWLYNKSHGVLGKRIATITTSYNFPNTKEGMRAQLLEILEREDSGNYKKQWLDRTKWTQLEPKMKNELARINYGVLPRFGEFWLQSPSEFQPTRKKLEPNQSKRLLGTQ